MGISFRQFNYQKLVVGKGACPLPDLEVLVVE
jgi:hypothetical protein